jgi:hypothetical protein
MGRTIGYVYLQVPELPDLATIWRATSISSLHGLKGDTVQSVVQCVQESINQAQSMGEQLNGLGADDVLVFFNRSKEQAWNEFIVGMEPGTKVLVSDYDQISLDPKTLLNHLVTAKNKNILVVATEQSALLSLDLDTAFTLQQQWVMKDIETEVSADRRNPNADYEKLRDLMNEGLSVTQIMDATGWSRSTVFRNRRIHYKDLCRDVPKFRSKGFKVEEE